MSMTPCGIGYKINVFRSKSNKKTQIIIFVVKNISNNFVDHKTY